MNFMSHCKQVGLDCFSCMASNYNISPQPSVDLLLPGTPSSQPMDYVYTHGAVQNVSSQRTDWPVPCRSVSQMQINKRSLHLSCQSFTPTQRTQLVNLILQIALLSSSCFCWMNNLAVVFQTDFKLETFLSHLFVDTSLFICCEFRKTPIENIMIPSSLELN